ncbi:MAG TPA: hypothetical protein PLL10_02715 [Elusimicrobiales bacterium]|nr:hypothetical protein [Elusimicrobiales bacterium]
MKTLIHAEKLLDAGKPGKAFAFLKARKASGAEGRYLLGECARLTGDCRAAAAYYRQAVALSSSKADVKCRALNGLAASLRTLGLSGKALEAARQASRIAVEYGFEDLLLEARLEHAMGLRAAGRLRMALSELNKLYAEYRREGEPFGMAYIHWARGGLYRLQGRFGDSIREFQSSADISRRLRDDSSLGYAYFGLAGVSRVAGDITASERYYRLAGRIFAKSHDLFARAYAFCGLANALRQKGELNEALGLYHQADSLYSRIGDRADLGFVKWGMGAVLEAQGLLRGALRHYRQSEQLFKGYSEARGLVLSGLRQASVLYLLGRTAEAERKYDAAVRLARKEGLHTYLEHFT